MNLSSFVSHPCALCCSPTSMWCSRCQNAWYCCAEHLQSVCCLVFLPPYSLSNTTRAGLAPAQTRVHTLRPGGQYWDAIQYDRDASTRTARAHYRFRDLLRSRRRQASIYLIGSRLAHPLDICRALKDYFHTMPAAGYIIPGYLSTPIGPAILLRKHAKYHHLDTRAQRRGPQVSTAHLVLSCISTAWLSRQPRCIPHHVGSR